MEIVWYLQLIRFFLSNDVTVRGLRIENSPQFHLRFDDCERVRVDGLFVSSPASSPNTDGVHVENTTSVQILNSRIYNGKLNSDWTRILKIESTLYQVSIKL